MFLSVVIPSFNEEKAILAVLDEHILQLQGTRHAWEIVCLDDASTDDTWLILLEYAKREPRLRLLRNEYNRGISASFDRLYHEARGEYIYLTAADGQWPAEDLTRLLHAFDESKADLIVGVREGREKVYGLGRRALSYGFNFLAKIFLKMDVQDANGIKLGRRDIFIVPMRSKSFFVEIERLAMAYKKGYKIAYCPVIFLSRQHGQEKGARWLNTAQTIKDLLCFVFKRGR